MEYHFSFCSFRFNIVILLPSENTSIEYTSNDKVCCTGLGDIYSACIVTTYVRKFVEFDFFSRFLVQASRTYEHS